MKESLALSLPNNSACQAAFIPFLSLEFLLLLPTAIFLVPSHPWSVASTVNDQPTCRTLLGGHRQHVYRELCASHPHLPLVPLLCQHTQNSQEILLPLIILYLHHRDVYRE